MASHPHVAWSPREEPSLWRDTAGPAPAFPSLTGDIDAEVAIIGGGYTGLSAALHLARDHGVQAVVLEAARVGWGASGRNGGFCVPGGAKLSLGQIARQHGRDEAARFFDLTLAAVERVDALLRDEAIDAESQPGGELVLAHSPAALKALAHERDEIAALHGHRRELLAPETLRERGLHSDAFFGGLQEPIGFGLHPLRYVHGLARAAVRRGVQVFEDARVNDWGRVSDGHMLRTREGVVGARRVVVATSAYTPESGSRACGAAAAGPVQYHRHPAAETAERAAQGWTSTQVVCDSRILLHYFRLLPDGRFLFGGRGGLGDAPKARVAFRRRLHADFRRLFPAWREVEITHFWRGLVDVAADRTPHCAAMGDDPSVLVGCAYHGSGVAMATEIGAQLAALAVGAPAPALPRFVARPAPRFPFSSMRRLYLAGAISVYGVQDRLT